MRNWHVSWAVFLDNSPPWYRAPDSIGSANDQWLIVGLYDARIYVVQSLAAGDSTYYGWLMYELERGKQGHIAWMQYLEANPWHPLNFTTDNSEGQRRYIAEYDWRMGMVAAIVWHCQAEIG